MRCKGMTLQNKQCKNNVKHGDFCKTHTTLFTVEKPEECSICTEKLGELDRPIKCGHYFHTACFKEWVKHKSAHQCPVCRTYVKQPKITKIDLTSIEMTESNISVISQALSMLTGLPLDSTRNILLSELQLSQ